MALTPFSIAPIKHGEKTNVAPFYLPNDAYKTLEDAYVWRGRIKKRFGTSLIGPDMESSALRLKLGTTNASGDFSAVVPGSIFKVGQRFSIESQIFTINVLGSPEPMIYFGDATSATFNETTALVDIQGSENSLTDVYFYPAESVMGIFSREEENPTETNTVAFDTQFSYIRIGHGWDRLGTTIWSGSDWNFFWKESSRGINLSENYLYITNYKDNIKYLPPNATEWGTLYPTLNTSGPVRKLSSCLCLISFKGRLLALNTGEEKDNVELIYANRCRYSLNGDPTNNATSWLEKPGFGGFVDAPTRDRIKSAQRLVDTVLVFFEDSTWELSYTGSVELPFKWKKIDSNFGSVSMFSTVNFDQAILSVGDKGIHACNGSSIERIDTDIPGRIFTVERLQRGRQRIYGVRDFYTDLVYWSFADETFASEYPNKLLVYNYEDNTWATFKDSFTCFGYLKEDEGALWEEQDFAWLETSSSWTSEAVINKIATGNQQGVVSVIENNKTTNAASLYITDMYADVPGNPILVEKHCLSPGDYIIITGAHGIIFEDFDEYDLAIFEVVDVYSSDIFGISGDFTGSYEGGGKVILISNFRVETKDFNFGMQNGQKFRIPYIDFLMDATIDGEFSVSHSIDTSPYYDGDDEVMLGNRIVLTKPEDGVSERTEAGSQMWHRFYTHSEGAFISLAFYLNDDQMRDFGISGSNFVLHALTFYIQPQGRQV